MKMYCPHHNANSRRPLTFKLPSFQEDEKLAFVDSVCATLMTSRFGWGAMYTLNPRFEGTADEPFDYLGLLEEELVGWHEAATFLGSGVLGRAISGGASRDALLQKPARSKGIGFANPTLGRNPTPCETPANLGRGSPISAGRFISSRRRRRQHKAPGVSPGNRRRDIRAVVDSDRAQLARLPPAYAGSRQTTDFTSGSRPTLYAYIRYADLAL